MEDTPQTAGGELTSTRDQTTNEIFRLIRRPITLSQDDRRDLVAAIAEVTHKPPEAFRADFARVIDRLIFDPQPYTAADVREFGRRFCSLCNPWARDRMGGIPSMENVRAWIHELRRRRKKPSNRDRQTLGEAFTESMSAFLAAGDDEPSRETEKAAAEMSLERNMPKLMNAFLMPAKQSFAEESPAARKARNDEIANLIAKGIPPEEVVRIVSASAPTALNSQEHNG